MFLRCILEHLASIFILEPMSLKYIIYTEGHGDIISPFLVRTLKKDKY